MLCLLLFPMAVMAQAPSYPVRLDLQSPSRTFALKWAAGSSPILSAYVSDGGRAYTNLSGWTGYVYVAVTPTAGVYVAASPVASNRVDFSFTAARTATVGTFGVEVVLGNGTNTYRWGTGSLSLSNSPALLGAGTVPLTGVFNWDLYTFTGTQPPLSASYTNALAGDVTGVPGVTVIGDGVVGTNNLDTEVRASLLLANTAAQNEQNITGRWFAVGNTNSGLNAWVGGGSANIVTGSYASVGGGYNNSAAGSFASVFGGYANIADGLDASVGGGYKNSASGSFASVCGGYQNSAAGYAASVGGGWQNSSAGLYSTIPGGRNNYAGNYAFAAGTGARATNDGSFVVSLPGDTNATFGSRADNSFNVRSVGGAYFLSSGLWIQDTNGNTIAAFTPTNSTLSGTLNLTGYATTGAVSSQVSASGLGATNFGLAIGAGATALVAQASAAGTNFAMAIGAGNSNLTLSAWETASNGLATARAAQVQASNINAGAWSQIATNTITAPSNSAVRIGLSLGLSGEAMLGQASAIAPQAIEMYGWTSSSGVQSGRYTMGWSGGQVYPAWGTSSSTNLFYGPWNFSASSYTLYAEFAAYKTNAIKLYAGAVTQNQVTARNEAWFSGTNLWIGLGGTNSMRFNGVLNAY
mgnify:CR=1 FL=1